ncbi:hypothetical protein TCAL_09317, partial [Tigriopus californicus]|eukprot:TCALIF_09317-PA protein Name:"Similar to GLRA2 Glycine receptor subunit alpha-2 (Homo sapiens)" AED:0.12 eAED:0.12 QI:0/1/0.66/1/0.6/0.66/6/0/449
MRLLLRINTVLILMRLVQAQLFEDPWDQLDQCSCSNEDADVPVGFLSLVGGALKVPRDYNKNVQPPGKPTIVDIGFIVNDVLEIDDDAYSVTLKMEMPMYWNDSRIQFNTTLLDQVSPNRWLYIDPNWKDDLWFPSLVVQNMQEFKTITSIKSNEKLMITEIPDKRFHYVAMHLIKFTCGLKFDFFPFDIHLCSMKVHLDSPVEELSLDFFHGSHLKWGWANTTTILDYGIDFEPLSIEALLETNTMFNGITYQKSISGFVVKLSRKVSVYLFNYFIPSGLFVVVSWVSLIIPPDAVPGRVALIITTFLVLVNIANTVFSSSPTADTINPIQVWILACIVFVFMTVLEYAYILFMMRRVKRHILMANNLKKNKPRKSSKVYTTEETPKISTLSSARTHSLTSPIPEHDYVDCGTVKEFLTDGAKNNRMSNIRRRLEVIRNRFLDWRSKV